MCGAESQVSFAPVRLWETSYSTTVRASYAINLYQLSSISRFRPRPTFG
jgi:hypothetical protein